MGCRSRKKSESVDVVQDKCSDPSVSECLGKINKRAVGGTVAPSPGFKSGTASLALFDIPSGHVWHIAQRSERSSRRRVNDP